jgi:hypothetical protein
MTIDGSEASRDQALRKLLWYSRERSIRSVGELHMRDPANAFHLIAGEPPMYSGRGKHWPDNG